MDIDVIVFENLYTGINQSHFSSLVDNFKNKKSIHIICSESNSTIEYENFDLHIIKDITETKSCIKDIIESLKTDYVFFINGNDGIVNNFYNDVITLIDKYKPDMLRLNYNLVNANNDKICIDNERAFIETCFEIKSIYSNPQLIYGHPSFWSGIYKLEFLTSHKLTDYIDPDDDTSCLFTYKCFFESKNTIWYNNPLIDHNVDNDNYLNKKIKYDNIEKHKKAIQIIQNEYRPSREIKWRLYAQCISYSKNALKFDDSYYTVSSIKSLLQTLDDDVIRSDFSNDEIKFYNMYSSPLPSMKKKSNKILIYNWLPFDNPWNWGGGVTVYCRNIIDGIITNYPDTEIVFLSSGFAYDATSKQTYYRKIDNIFGDKIQQYEFVNSPIPAEQRYLYVNPCVAIENQNLKNLFKKFIDENGPFKAIHFNNIEGLSFDIFDLKENYVQTKFIYSIHNYIPICVNGSYYMRHKHCICNPNHTAEDCFKCTRADIRSEIANTTYERGKYGHDIQNCINKDEWINQFNLKQLDEDVTIEDILKFSQTLVAKINKYCDTILAVSKRVYDIAKENGIDDKKMIVSYIGTKIASHQIRRSKNQPDEYLRLVFLGTDPLYEEKGYPFLLKALSKLPIEYSSKIKIRLTMKPYNQEIANTYLSKFNEVKIIEGYTHDDLNAILNECDLSIIPVVWEDNLPQIAIESVALGVPLLTSDAGGAQELCSSNVFKFKSNNTDDFIKKLMNIVDNRHIIDEYWANHNGLVTIREHIEQLMNIYGHREMDHSLTSKDLKSLIEYIETENIKKEKIIEKKVISEILTKNDAKKKRLFRR